MSRVLGLLVCVALAGCGGGDRGFIHASGHVEATDVRVPAKVGGRVVAVSAQEGDSVSAGDVLAQIDTVDLALDVRRLSAELARAEAHLRLLEAGPRPEEVRRGVQELARAEAELAAASRDLERVEALSARDATTAKALDDARTRREIAACVVEAARAAQERLLAGARREEIEMAAAQRDAAAAALEAARQRLRDATVRSPLSGVVTARIVEPGEIVAPGTVLCVVTDLLHPWLVVYLDEPSLSQVRLGDSVLVRVDGRGGPLTGVLTYVAKVAEFTPKNVQTPNERAKLVFRAKVSLQNDGGIFKPGMPADAFFRRRAREGG